MRTLLGDVLEWASPARDAKLRTLSRRASATPSRRPAHRDRHLLIDEALSAGDVRFAPSAKPSSGQVNREEPSRCNMDFADVPPAGALAERGRWRTGESGAVVGDTWQPQGSTSERAPVAAAGR